MGAICGVVSKNGEDAVDPLVKMLMEISHRGPDGASLTWDDETHTVEDIEKLGSKISNKSASKAIGHLSLSNTGSHEKQPFETIDNDLKLIFNGEIYNKNFLDDNERNICQNGEMLFQQFEKKYNGSTRKAVMQSVHHLDGVYALALMDKYSITIYRDEVGVKPVYYGENRRFIGFASEKRSLWKLGIKSQRLKPGELMEMNYNNTYRKIIAKLNKVPIYFQDREIAMKAYQETLFNAIKKRLVGQERVGVLLSGGVDSSLVAKIAKEFIPEVIGYTGGIEGSSDLINAKIAAESLGIPLKIRILNHDTILGILPEVIEAIEDRDLLQVEAAIPMFAALESAKADGIRVMLSGQGADELFAGYEWYPTIYKEKGEKVLLDNMWEDITNAYRDTLEREDKMSMWNSIELKVPLLDPEVIKISMMISPRLKINHQTRLGKVLHRELAKKLGIPSRICLRNKEGAQHGSGIHQALEELSMIHQYKKPKMEVNLDEYCERGSALKYNGKFVKNNRYGKVEPQNMIDAIAASIFNDGSRH